MYQLSELLLEIPRFLQSSVHTFHTFSLVMSTLFALSIDNLFSDMKKNKERLADLILTTVKREIAKEAEEPRGTEALNRHV